MKIESEVTNTAFQRTLSDLGDPGRQPYTDRNGAISSKELPSHLFGTVHEKADPIDSKTIHAFARYISNNSDYVARGKNLRHVETVMKRLRSLCLPEAQRSLALLDVVLQTQKIHVKMVALAHDKTVVRVSYGMINALLTSVHAALASLATETAIPKAAHFAAGYERTEQQVIEWLEELVEAAKTSAEFSTQDITGAYAKAAEHLVVSLLKAVDPKVEIEMGDLQSATNPATLLVARLSDELRESLHFQSEELIGAVKALARIAAPEA